MREIAYVVLFICLSVIIMIFAANWWYGTHGVSAQVVYTATPEPPTLTPEPSATPTFTPSPQPTRLIVTPKLLFTQDGVRFYRALDTEANVVLFYSVNAQGQITLAAIPAHLTQIYGSAP